MDYNTMKMDYLKWLKYDENIECLENMLNSDNLELIRKITNPTCPRELQYGAAIINLQNDLYKVSKGENLKELDLTNSLGVNYIVKRLNEYNDVPFNEEVTYDLVYSFSRNKDELYRQIAHDSSLDIYDRLDYLRIETEMGLFFRYLDRFIKRSRKYEAYPEIIDFSNNFYKIYNENIEIDEKKIIK